MGSTGDTGSTGSEEDRLRAELAELRAREARLREGLQRQVDLSRRLREYAAHLRRKLREPRRGAEAVFAEVAEVSAEALGVARVSVWLVDAARRVLACRHLHVRGLAPGLAGELPLAELQRYVRALTTDLVAAEDVTVDARTSEIQTYCADRRIGALIDVPVVLDGEILGVVCYEHVGGPRVWHDAEVDFAANLGSVVALAIEAERRQEAQDRAHAAVAEQLRLEAELAQQHKFESLGRMATAVAHDFNHVLTVISLSLERGARTAAAGTGAGGGSDPEITAAMGYARELVTSLLWYARREPVAVADVDVDAAIGELVPVLAAAIGKELSLDVDLRAAGARVRIAPAELHQLVVNMVTNAGDATRGHGRTVRVTTAVSAGRGAPGRVIELRIADDGRGMDEATRARVFDPFFTTKPAGEGTGIGLATCQSIVARAGGTIDVDSEPGAGARFRILLPEADGRAEEAAPHARADGPAAGHRVLLVEDSPTIGGLVSGALREAGYEVMHVTTLAQALAAIEAERFGAVVADLRLPDGRGEQVVAAARARSDRTAILVTSGEVTVLNGVDAIVMKPFTAEALKAALAGALEQRRAGR